MLYYVIVYDIIAYDNISYNIMSYNLLASRHARVPSHFQATSLGQPSVVPEEGMSGSSAVRSGVRGTGCRKSLPSSLASHSLMASACAQAQEELRSETSCKTSGGSGEADDVSTVEFYG